MLAIYEDSAVSILRALGAFDLLDDDRDDIGRGGRIDFTDAEDAVEEAGEESFPASDPPSWSPVPVGAPGLGSDD